MKKFYKKNIEKAKFMAKAFIWLNNNKKLFPWKTYKIAKMFPKHIYFLHCQYNRGKIYYKKLYKPVFDCLSNKTIIKWVNKFEIWMRKLF